jgi:predicted phosphodiesterase
MMIFMFGDIHGSFRHVRRVVDEHRPNAIILLGDVEAQQPLEKELADVMGKTEVWWIPGNHDTDSHQSYENLFGSALTDRNLHGKIVEIDGVRVAGLGGVFREEIWYPDPATSPAHFDSYSDYAKHSEPGRILAAQRIRASKNGKQDPKAVGKLLKHKSSIFYGDWFELYGRQADILVTHEAPSSHRHGFSVIDDLARSLHAKFSFHGHQHEHYRHAFEEFVAHGVGFRAVTDQYGGMISEGERSRRDTQ